MTDVPVPEFPDFDTMTQADFERYLPDFFAASSNGKVSSDPRLQHFLAQHPDCAALVHDLEAIGDQARAMFNIGEEPSDRLWDKIVDRMDSETATLTAESDRDSHQ